MDFVIFVDVTAVLKGRFQVVACVPEKPSPVVVIAVNLLDCARRLAKFTDILEQEMACPLLNIEHGNQ